MESLINFAEIKRRRLLLKLTLDEAARRAGWKSKGARTIWADLESGRYPDPRISRVVAAADVLGCSIDQLLSARK